MAIPPEVVQINPDDVEKDDKKLAEYLAGILNNYLLQATDGLNRQLTFNDNFRGQTKTLTLTGGEDITFKFDGTGTPRGLIMTSFRNTSTPTEVLTIPVGIPQWSYDGKTAITIKEIRGFTAGEKYLTTFVILGE